MERSCEAFLQFVVALAISRLGVDVTVRPHTAPLAAYTHTWFIQVDMWRAMRWDGGWGVPSRWKGEIGFGGDEAVLDPRIGISGYK